MKRSILLLAIAAIAAGCSNKGELSFRVCYRRSSSTSGVIDYDERGPDVNHYLAITKSPQLWPGVASRLAGRVEDTERLRTTLKFTSGKREVTPQAFKVKVTASAEGAGKDDVAFALEATFESLRAYLAAYEAPGTYLER